MAAPTSSAKLNLNLANGVPSTHGWEAECLVLEVGARRAAIQVRTLLRTSVAFSSIYPDEFRHISVLHESSTSDLSVLF